MSNGNEPDFGFDRNTEGPTLPVEVVVPGRAPQRVSPDVALASPTMMQALKGTPPTVETQEQPVSVRSAYGRIVSGKYYPEDVWALKDAGLLTPSQAQELLFGAEEGTSTSGSTWRPGEFDLMLRQFEESIRRFNEEQAEERKSRSLQAASTALSNFLDAQTLADARRLQAMQETRALLPMAVPSTMRYAPGLEPSGPIATMAGKMGAQFTPFEVSQVQVRPSQLAQPANIGQALLDRLTEIQRLGAA